MLLRHCYTLVFVRVIVALIDIVEYADLGKTVKKRLVLYPFSRAAVLHTQHELVFHNQPEEVFSLLLSPLLSRMQ